MKYLSTILILLLLSCGKDSGPDGGGGACKDFNSTWTFNDGSNSAIVDLRNFSLGVTTKFIFINLSTLETLWVFVLMKADGTYVTCGDANKDYTCDSGTFDQGIWTHACDELIFDSTIGNAQEIWR